LNCIDHPSFPYTLTSFPPIARTTNAAVETGHGNVPKALILEKKENSSTMSNMPTKKPYPIAN
jgi:hypothetical protein